MVAHLAMDWMAGVPTVVPLEVAVVAGLGDGSAAEKLAEVLLVGGDMATDSTVGSKAGDKVVILGGLEEVVSAGGSMVVHWGARMAVLPVAR